MWSGFARSPSSLLSNIRLRPEYSRINYLNVASNPAMRCSPTEALRVTEHRPWPLPKSPWVMFQAWNDLLFAHWNLPIADVRRFIPSPLELDTFDGQAWVAVTPFYISGLRPRFFPPLPGISDFPELNVRTYVTYAGKGGVFFFSLDAASRLAVKAARTFYRLPYRFARMMTRKENDQVFYSCSRRERSSAEFHARYWPISSVRRRPKGTLEHWLSERYRLYTVSAGKLFHADIHHVPWPLQDAKAEIATNTMALTAGIHLPDQQPLLHYARRLDVFIWPLVSSE